MFEAECFFDFMCAITLPIEMNKNRSAHNSYTLFPIKLRAIWKWNCILLENSFLSFVSGSELQVPVCKVLSLAVSFRSLCVRFCLWE